jgi:mannose-6-phosphate isomerase
VIPLDNPIRSYAWGSRSVLAALQRRPVPSPGPEAEMWLGAHPAAPSLVRGTAGLTPLPEAIAADPAAMLGAGVTKRFGNRLPYLLKVLAAERPLSLQAHPDAEQAQAGFAREEAAGVPVRSYVDPFHKPELLVALDDFEALCGFRDPDASADELAALEVPALAPVIAALRAGSVQERLGVAVALLLGWPDDDRLSLVAAVVKAGHPLAVRLAEEYPADVGVVVALLLNHVRLGPGEAVFMPAGNLHAYLRGAGVEIMAASDNVLRGGLTPKHVDAAELMRVLRYEALAEPLVAPTTLGPGMACWRPDVAEFALVRATVAGTPVRLPGTGPRIVLCVHGTASLCSSDAGPGLDLWGGDAAFVAASEPAVEVSGECVVFQAAPNV